MSLTYKKARELFNYRPDGNLIWKVSKGGKKIGSIAGPKTKVGYSFIKIDGKDYRAHRLIWLWHHGYTPECGLDHINRIKHDNRIENLRESSQQCNLRNTDNFRDNTSGVKGVYRCKRYSRGFWMAYVRVQGKLYNLGRHKAFSEAVLHRLAAEQCLGWAGCGSSSPAYMYALENGLVKACGE